MKTEEIFRIQELLRDVSMLIVDQSDSQISIEYENIILIDLLHSCTQDMISPTRWFIYIHLYSAYR